MEICQHRLPVLATIFKRNYLRFTFFNFLFSLSLENNLKNRAMSIRLVLILLSSIWHTCIRILIIIFEILLLARWEMAVKLFRYMDGKGFFIIYLIFIAS